METPTPLQRYRTHTWRPSILGVCLLATSFWAILEIASRRQTLAWDGSLVVRVVPLLDPSLSQIEFVDSFLEVTDQSARLAGLGQWLQAEYARHTSQPLQALRWDISDAQPVSAPPPRVSPESTGLVSRWWSTERFLSYFQHNAPEQRHGPVASTIYVYFYPTSERHRFSGQSVACDRSKSAFVFVPTDSNTSPFYLALLAHELCHTLGATDKYRGDSSVYPEGYVEPTQSPRFPQEHAEIMALSIPFAPGQEAQVTSLQDCRIGAATARELGWVESR